MGLGAVPLRALGLRRVALVLGAGGATACRAVAYSPALVAFVGGSGGYVGWFPLAPRDPFYPWWRRGPTVAVTNVTYVNRTYVTVVNQTVFVSGRNVSRDFVHDRTVIRTVEATPVLRGPVPVVPTARLDPDDRPDHAAGPAARGDHARGVVVRVPPPAAPPRFDAKVPVIRENRGAPVTTGEAARMSTQDRSQPAARVRPVAPASGDVTLAPRNDAVKGPRPEPVAPARRPTRGRRAGGRAVAASASRRRPAQRRRPRSRPRPRAPARLADSHRAPRRSEPAARAPGGAASDRATAAATRGDAGTRGRRTRPGPAAHARAAQPAERIAPEPKPAERRAPDPKTHSDEKAQGLAVRRSLTIYQSIQ